MYVVIGILVNRYGRGIESMPELFPNHSFWADFPFLVKVCGSSSILATAVACFSRSM